MSMRRRAGAFAIVLLLAGCTQDRPARQDEETAEQPIWLKDPTPQPELTGHGGQADGKEADGPSTRSQEILWRAQERAALAKQPSVITSAGKAQALPPLPVMQGYRLQLATLPDVEAATKTWAALQATHPEVLGQKRMILIDLDHGYRGIDHRIEAGPYATKVAAWEACLALLRRKQGCVVTGP